MAVADAAAEAAVADMAVDAAAVAVAVDAAAVAVDAAAAVVAAADDATNNSPGHLLLLRYFLTRQGFRIHRRQGGEYVIAVGFL